MDFIEISGFRISRCLHDFVNGEVLPGTGLEVSDFWSTLIDSFRELSPRNVELLDERSILQSKIDEWHKERSGESIDPVAYRSFLEDIGYICSSGGSFSITTSNVDSEIATIAGPQLVVPILNSRFALNAANARWGSLYDALYGTDAIPESGDASRGKEYNPVRGSMVIDWARGFLDDTVPLSLGSWRDVVGFGVVAGALEVRLADNTATGLQDSDIFVGYNGAPDSLTNILLRHHGLHIDIVIDSSSAIGSLDSAGISDVVLESALTSIMDNEDSIAAVDAADKVIAYRNWLGLIKGDLESSFDKGGERIVRRLSPPRTYTSVDGSVLSLKSQVVMLHRNVGHLMRTPAILDDTGSEVFEGILDAMIIAAIGIHDVGNKHVEGCLRNSSEGSIYIVKPKMHSASEVSFAIDIFVAAERLCGLPTGTLKIGIMDEERRMSVNLREAIRAASDRVVFINTGFLDRTGDEIFTSMESGIMIRKSDMKRSTWISAYEDRNVDIGLSCGFSGRAQIGKGMWAAPDRMSAMLSEKIGHPESGANTAWVPSPTAATLHSTHYHRVDVFSVQSSLSGRVEASLEDILSIPLAPKPNWTDSDIQQELDNNAQGILGYVVRWIDHGVGCSKVPDINDIGLMEDRATLRISSQHMANWLHHGVVDESRIVSTMRKMAAVVDSQNADDPNYEPMSGRFDESIAFRAALDLVLKARVQPSGYTEPLLHFHRLRKKSESSDA